MSLFNWIKRRAPASREPASNSGAANAPEPGPLPEAPSAAPPRIESIPAQEQPAATTVPVVSTPEVPAQNPTEPDTGLAAATDTQTGADPSRTVPPPLDPPGTAAAASLPPAPPVPGYSSIPTRQVTATVRATGEDGRIRWRGSHPPVHPGEPGAGLLPAAILPPVPVAPNQPEPVMPPVSAPATPAEAIPIVPETISLRLEPILKQLPLELETPEIRALRGSDTRVELPTPLIREQLADGRVSISAGTVAKGLPEAERPVFEKLAPDALIPIPLQEIFTKLPVSILKPRSDQVEEPLGELIPTPFSVQAQEDAIRFAGQRAETPAARPSEPAAPYRAGTPPRSAPAGQGMVPIPPEAVPNLAKGLTRAIREAPEALQAIFLRDDVVDLTSALQAVIHLPGVQGAVLNNAEGEALAGYLGHLPGSAPAIRIATESLNTISQRFAGLQPECLESVSFHLGNHQITGFVDGVMYLIVVHTARPFRPGVREKIHAFMRELVRLSGPAAH